MVMLIGAEQAVRCLYMHFTGIETKQTYNGHDQPKVPHLFQ